MKWRMSHALMVLAVIVCLPVGAATRISFSATTSNPPATVVLSGTLRDFKGSNETGGHADFEYTPTGGFGLYQQIVQDTLGTDGVPTFRSSGVLVKAPAADTAGNPILTGKSYIQSRLGDVAAQLDSSKSGAVHSSTSFYQWFHDVPGVNKSKQLTLTLNYDATKQQYVFDDTTDPLYSSLGGFFPVNGILFGNTPGWNTNYAFTLEVHTVFTYQAGANQVFTFRGDDDLWVFINGKLVIDLGGVHSVQSQTIALDRLGLTSQTEYPLEIFFGERHTVSSDFHIETNLKLAAAGSKHPIIGWTEVEPGP